MQMMEIFLVILVDPRAAAPQPTTSAPTNNILTISTPISLHQQPHQPPHYRLPKSIQNIELSKELEFLFPITQLRDDHIFFV